MNERTKHRSIEIYEATRIRTEMFLGTRSPETSNVLHFDGEKLEIRSLTWVPALWTCVRELIDNAVDELVAHGHGDMLSVSYDPEAMVVTVEDNGHGLPLDEMPSVGKGPAASILLARAFSGDNFDADRVSMASMNGVGASMVNFTSEYFELQVYGRRASDGTNKKFFQRWEEGVYAGKPIHRTKGPAISRGSKTKHGTKITFRPSAKVYPDMELPAEFVLSRLWEIAVTNPKLRVYFNGDRLSPVRSRDVIKATYFQGRNVAVIPVEDGDFHASFYLVPGFLETGTHMHTLVNNIATLRGGSHEEAFLAHFLAQAVEKLEKQAERVGAKLRRDDITEGLLIFGSVRMREPVFDSQAKVYMVKDVKPHFKVGFDPFTVGSVFRRNPEWAKAIIDNARQRTEQSERRAIKKKQRKLSTARVAKLSDANGKNREQCTLFLMEGDSAKSNFPPARDPEKHGFLPLRGKIMNVHRASLRKVMASEPLSDIMTAIGLRIGEEPENLRYGKVFITPDEDEDGKNICAQCVNYLYRFWPDLFRQHTPVVYKFNTPFVVLSRQEERRYIYADDYAEFQSNLADYKGWDIRRAKGLGSLEPEDWEYALAHPRLTPIVDDGGLGEALDLIFNPTRADDRKEWLADD